MSRFTREVVVVGGGVVGGLCALELARAGVDDVVVLERDAPGSGASGRAAGHLTIYRHERFGPEPSRVGRELYEALESREDDLTFHREPSFSVAYTDEGADHLRDQHASLPVETELLEPADLATRRPVFAVERMTAVLRFAEAVWTDPERLTHAVHAAARDAGADLEVAEVTDLEPGEGGLVVETTGDDRYRAPVVVVAAGVWTEGLLRRAGADVALRPRTSQIAVLDPAEPLDLPIWGAPDVSVYGRSNPDGTVLFGGGVSTPVDDVEGFANRALVPFLGEVAELAPHVVPALEDASLHDDWAGRVSATPDRYPHVGGTEVEGLYVCGGFNGEGLSNGPFGARLLADLVSDREPLVDPGPFDPTRFDGDETFEIHNAVEWWADR